MKKCIISKAGHGDIPDIKAIEVACELSPWTIGAYEAEQKHRQSVMLKSIGEGGTIVGFLVGRAQEGGEAELLNIGTAPDFQRQGVGSTLIEEFCAICLQRRVSMIWLEVRASNLKAIYFYKSHGFIKKGIRPNFYSNPIEDADLMALTFN
ncbi:MAG: ribosomal protein S18-alanine N-acetyltransferase [Pyrinomonadaceae bacterium]